MSKGKRLKPTSDRLVQLAQDIIDPHVEPGPLDREDIREALCELIELRKWNLVPPLKEGETAPLLPDVAA